MIHERGSVLVEMVVLGCAVALLALPSLIAVGVLSEAQASVDGVAADAAVWIARHGTIPEPAVDGVDVEVSVVDGEVTVTARRSIVLIDVAGASVRRTVVGEAVAVISPYRSSR